MISHSLFFVFSVCVGDPFFFGIVFFFVRFFFVKSKKCRLKGLHTEMDAQEFAMSDVTPPPKVVVKVEPGEDGDDEDAELEALFGDSAEPEPKSPPPPKRKRSLFTEVGPYKGPPTEEELRQRRKALKKHRAKERRVKKRLKCDCYTDRALERAHVHLGTVEKAMANVRRSLPKLSEVSAKSEQDRIRECRRQLKEAVKALQTQHVFLAEIKRIAARGVERGNDLAMKIACITAKRTDQEVVTRFGQPFQVTHHEAFQALAHRQKPKPRRRK
jgi:hypothetical protein